MDNYKDVDILNFIFKEFHDGDIGKYTKERTAIDAGANIGNHTLYFMKEIGFARCYSFEPVKQTFLILQENIDINKLTENVDYFCVGLGKSKMSASILNYNFTNIGGTNLIAGDKGKDGEIEIWALDSSSFDGDVKFIKIDVEGMELDVVHGAFNLIEKNRPVIMIESFDKYNCLKEIFDDLNYSDIPLGPNDYLFFPDEL